MPEQVGSKLAKIKSSYVIFQVISEKNFELTSWHWFVLIIFPKGVLFLSIFFNYPFSAKRSPIGLKFSQQQIPISRSIILNFKLLLLTPSLWNQRWDLRVNNKWHNWCVRSNRPFPIVRLRWNFVHIILNTQKMNCENFSLLAPQKSLFSSCSPTSVSVIY